MIRLGGRAVEVGRAGEEPVDPVAVAVAPGGDGAARRGIVHGRRSRAGGPLNMVRYSGPDRT